MGTKTGLILAKGAQNASGRLRAVATISVII